MTASATFGFAKKWPKRENLPLEFCHSRNFFGGDKRSLPSGKRLAI
jgi:hypothetical protein